MEGNSDDEQEEYYCTSDDDGVSVDGILEFSVNSNSRRSSSCQVISRESILKAQRDDLRRVMELLLVREHHARTLLIYYHWNVERLLSVFVEKGKTHLFAEAGVTIVELDDLGSSTLACDICIEEVPCNEATRMDCGHAFCNNCWTEHFIVKINEGQCKRIRCMGYKCSCICDEGIIRNLLSRRNPNLAEKFDRFLLDSYIEDRKNIKWCPSIPHCGNAISIKDDDEVCEVECICGLQFCFSCLFEPHSPCSCLMWKLWSKKCNDESLAAKWISVNTKNCPSCLKPVEKNGGCNHVRCVCGNSFCWGCGNKLPHINYKCNSYKVPEEVENARQYLYRYLHYYNRYKAHRDSMKLEAKLEETVKKKVSISEEKEPELRDFSWVKDGVYRLFRSRRILSYSYAFAFYMFDDNLFKGEMNKNTRLMKQNLFEDQQQQLEAKVEQLSGLLEEPFDKFTVCQVETIRLQVVVLTNIVDDLCKKLYDCIENDLLGSLQRHTQNIAPYKSKGAVKASELAENECVTSQHVMKGCWMENGQPSGSSGSNGSGQPSEKRAKLEDSKRSYYLDLNFPADQAEPNKD